MDDFEKVALRRRKPVFAEFVDMGKELLSGFQSRGLLNQDAVELINAEKNPGQKAAKLVDWLLESKVEKAFHELTCVLVSKYAWLGKEMQTEVRIERGDVIIDEDVLREAGTLVHRKFGTSRRFAETDKKDMTDLIAVKIQLSKEEWRLENEQVRQELERYMDLCKQKDEIVKMMDATIVRFLKKHEEDLESRAHDMTSTSDVIKMSLNDNDHLGKLRERIRYFLARTKRVIEERDLMTREREKCMKALQAKDQTMALNDVMVSKMAELPQQLEKYKRELDSKEELIERLRKINESYEKEIQKKELTLTQTREALVVKDTGLAELKAQIKDLDSKHNESKANGSAQEKRQNGASKGSTGLKPGSARTAASATSRKAVGSLKK